MGKKIKKNKVSVSETEKSEVEAQVVTEVVTVATPLIIIALTAIFRTVISFFTWKWLEWLFPKKEPKNESDDSQA
tara:strand:- start:134 stop:358 length:225 start_codon:yes stop_codon:yes gene_type:complete